MKYKRQEGIFNPDKVLKEVAIIGCGSVGSFTALALAKMGVKVTTICDDDIIENHNIPNQFYKHSQVGMQKTEALKELLEEFSDCSPETRERIYETDSLAEEIIISSVDSMEARKEIWEAVQRSEPEYYIDTRMGGKVFSIFVVDMADDKTRIRYANSIYEEKDAAEIACTERTIIFNVLGLASFVCNHVVKLIKEEECPAELHFDYENYKLVKPK